MKLIGLDFGTTTSSAVVASAALAENAVTGRAELTQLRECYRSEMVFTPIHNERLDLKELSAYLNEWLAAGGAGTGELFGGGALLTGLAAQKSNASGLVQIVNQRLGDALIAAADDPCFESWLAFMGSCAGLSRGHPNTLMLNLDIGGGTTNLALGKNGDVLRTGCLFVGARHVQVEPGTYKVTKLSPYAAMLFEHLEIRKAHGDELNLSEVDRILDFYMKLLEAAVTGDTRAFQDPVARRHQHVAFRAVTSGEKMIVTLSGGVGELVYAHFEGRGLPPTTFFGDLGIDLARRLIESTAWADDFHWHIPSGQGRATVYGLLRHSTQVSGHTLFLPDSGVLPLKSLPILGSVSPSATDVEIHELIDLVHRSSQGGCLQVRLGASDDSAVPELGRRIATVLAADRFPARHPLVLLTDRNVGKVLGHYVTDWGRLSYNVVVIDEIAIRDAQFIQIGKLQNQVVPVSFHGMNRAGDATW